ncbi:MAG: hypothetical protein IKP28_00780 [Clostridia bacterium]|nr:hypothetical protein [Clostridia bacterium]
MKVLFAVNNENVSEEIVKKYQKDYKEIIAYKNVYYFNAIIKEMQRDKTYDRIVIGEDLEPFANNNYDTIDKFLFEKLDSISDEATDNGEKDAQIILICSDRRTKSDSLLVKLFGIGVYSAIIGKDRSIEEVCRLINTPRTKKEAKQYYKIDSDDVSYKAENDTDVNENEIQSILKHYKTLGKNEDKYVESFNNIASQYTDAQLRIIIKFLPMNVKAVLEEKSPKYQQVVMFGEQQYKRRNTTDITKTNAKQKDKDKKKTLSTGNSGLVIDSIEKKANNPLTGQPIIIPSQVKTEKTQEVEKILQDFQPEPEEIETVEEDNSNNTEQDQFVNLIELGEEPEKNTELNENGPEDILFDLGQDESEELQEKKGRGRPKKISNDEEDDLNLQDQSKRGRGRPKKNADNVNLFDLSEEAEQPEESSDTSTLPGVDENIENNNENNNASVSAAVLPGFETIKATEPESAKPDNTYQPPHYNNYAANNNYAESHETSVDKTGYDNRMQYANSQDNLIVGDKKMVAFVGSTKNGTSFIVNNLAALFSSMGINTAILDTTENKNSFYIYTDNEEELRKTAYNSIPKLKNGVADGIHVDKFLSVYTSLPGENTEKENIKSILDTIESNHELVLIDCDFNTPIEYFKNAQEIYLVQSMDVLTIQPLTAFMRDLKNNGVLQPEKLRIIINKYTKIRGLNDKVLLGGMAFYNSPSMSFMTELFNKEMVKYCSIPLDENTYVAYLEAMVSCKISLKQYSNAFIDALKKLAEMVYPLLNKPSQRNNKTKKEEPESKNYFSPGMNNTLEQMNRMKNGY